MPSAKTRSARSARSRSRKSRSLAATRRSRSLLTPRSSASSKATTLANNVYAFRPTSNYQGTPYPRTKSMANNLSPLNNNSINANIPPFTPYSNSATLGNMENELNLVNSPSLVNNILENTPTNSFASNMYTPPPATKQTLSGTLGGKYRIEGEVTLTPL